MSKISLELFTPCTMARVKAHTYLGHYFCITYILMTNENATPFRCAKLRPIKSCAQICYVNLYSTIKATFLHNNLNSNDSTNIRRNVSLQITLIAIFGIYKKSQKFCTNVFCWSVDQLTFRHKVDCCDATLNTILSRNISLHKRRNGLD